MRRSSILAAALLILAGPPAAVAHSPEAARAAAGRPATAAKAPPAAPHVVAARRSPPGPAARPAPARGVLTRLGAARFDGARSAIEIPFSGPAPKATLFRLSPTHYYYEFDAARFVPGGAQYRKLGSNLERFTVANRPHEPVVRLSFRVTRATVPAVVVDADAQRIKVLPLGHEVALGSAPAIVPHGLALPLDRGGAPFSTLN
jgi:hypothetical protein